MRLHHHALGILADPYPQRRDWREVAWLDRVVERVRVGLAARWRLAGWQQQRFVDAVEQHTVRLDQLSAHDRAQALVDLSRRLRHAGPQDALAAEAFAQVRITAGAVLGMRHFASQIRGGRVMLQGCLVEMETGEGKTLTATLPAATMALAGRKVHVVTVNDYLAERDAQQMRPVYAALGLSTGLVLETMSPDEKQAQYRCDIVYCTSKTVTFDYLRDRVELGQRMAPLKLAMDRMVAGVPSTTMLPGLQFAIVDEADSIFVDEARTPLVISRSRPDPTMEAHYRQTMALARQLHEGEHYTLNEQGRRAELTAAGSEWLAQEAEPLGGLWRGRLRREELVCQALVALHGFERDIHYIVRDGKVMIVDDNTGRVMPDRSWERGLQQLMEVKEGVDISAEKETMARISFQLFFRRYLTLSGMSGTCREVAGEIAEVYGISSVRVAPHRPSRRQQQPTRVLATAEDRWRAVEAAILDCRARGQPVLVGTRSIAASEELSRRLTAQGIPHEVLNAKQDDTEAAIVAEAGQCGRVTIATNMAGRGTDIKLTDEARERGGLHVIVCERHDNARVDRQLVGRCARQGDPGSWQALLSLDDELLHDFWPWATQALQHALRRQPEAAWLQTLSAAWYRLAQRRRENAHEQLRKALLASDFRTRQNLSFSGQME